MFTLTFSSNDTEELPVGYQTYADAMLRLWNLFEATKDNEAKGEVHDAKTGATTFVHFTDYMLHRVGHSKHSVEHWPSTPLS